MLGAARGVSGSNRVSTMLLSFNLITYQEKYKSYNMLQRYTYLSSFRPRNQNDIVYIANLIHSNKSRKRGPMFKQNLIYAFPFILI